ncbi:MAG: hypothetical protein AAB151_04015, partial [Nitrospirota bacterium]
VHGFAKYLSIGITVTREPTTKAVSNIQNTKAGKILNKRFFKKVIIFGLFNRLFVIKNPLTIQRI